MVEAVAQSTETAPAMAGMISLSILASTVAGKARVIIKPKYSVPLNLWVLVSSAVGDTKTGVFGLLVEPLDWLEERLGQPRDPESPGGPARRTFWDHLLHEEDDAAKLRDCVEQVRAQCRDHCTGPHPHFYIDDTSTVGLEETLIEQGGRIALLSDEAGLLQSLAQRGSGVNIDSLLKTHPGTTIKVRRHSAERIIYSPAVSMGMMTQPEVLHDLIASRNLRRRGFVARWLMCAPETNLGTKTRDAPYVNEEVARKYALNLIAMAALPWQAASPGGRPNPHTITLSDDARDRLLRFEQELEPRMHPQHGDLRSISDWLSKLGGTTARMAGVLHLARQALGEPSAAYGVVGGDTMDNAIAVARYCLSEALSLFGVRTADSDNVEDAAAEITRWIFTTSRVQVAFTLTELERAVRLPAMVLVPALDLLVSRRLIEEVPSRRGGPGRRARRFVWSNTPPPGMEVPEGHRS
jgi:hypothetical protein